MRQITYQITIYRDRRFHRRRVEGYEAVSGLLAVRRDGRSWVVDHIPSGARGGAFRTFRHALESIRFAMPLIEDLFVAYCDDERIAAEGFGAAAGFVLGVRLVAVT